MTRYRPGHSLREHFADGVMHVAGVAIVIAGASGLMVWAAFHKSAAEIWPLAFYATGLLASFSFSAAYNLTLHAPTRAVLRRFDHAAIYLLIAGTYTPLALIGLGGVPGWGLAISAWVIALAGIVMKLGFFGRWNRLGFGMYLAMGWLGIIAAWPMVQALPTLALALIVLGGVIYTVGTLFHLGQSLPFSRAIWHGHVLLAAIAHFIAVVIITS